MNRKYWIVAIIIILIATFFKVATMLRSSPATPETGKIKVAATFYPLAYVAQQIGGEQIEVTTIIPPGAEPHDFEPTPRDQATIYESDVFIVNGYGVDAWAEKIIPELVAKNVTVIRMSDHINAMATAETDRENSGHEEAKSEYDPHFWLDPTNLIKQAEIIAAALIKIDADHSTAYNQNKDSFTQKLTALDQQYQAGLATCQSREIITAHDAFGYLTKRYNLTPFHILGLSPEEEPSPKTIAEIVKIAKEKNIKYIFFETEVDQKISQTIAQEIGAQTLVLNPIESLTKEEAKNNKDYISIMKENLHNLQTALVCR